MKRRNSIAILCSALFCFGLVLSGCNNNTSVPGGSSLDNVTNTWTVAFDSQGGSEVAAQIVNDGDLAVRPTDPTKQDYEFLGWYEEASAITPFDFNTPITTNWTLYAGWRRGQVEPPVEEYPYYVRIGDVTKGLTYYYGPKGNLLAEYTVNFASVQKDDVIEFLDAGKTAIYENIGPDPGDNNGVAAPAGFVIHNDAVGVSVYFKNWEDGGHSFWITGYVDDVGPVTCDYYLTVGDTRYDYLIFDLDGCPENQTGFYCVGSINVVKDDPVHFYRIDGTEIIENIGSDPEDNENHNLIVGTPGNYYIHNSGHTNIYFKTWADGGYSFWGDGYIADTPIEPEPQFFKIIVGYTAYALDELSLDGCPENQIGNFSYVIPAVHKDETVYFVDINDEEVLTNIGSEPEDNENHNNIVGTPGNFYIHNDATNVTVYFKTWADGGHSFWMTGYEADPVNPSDYSIQIGSNPYNFGATSLDGCPSNQTGNYTAEIPSVLMGEEVHFFKDDLEIIERIGTEPEDNENHNLITGYPGSYTIHNDAENVTVYFKTWDDGGYSFWATGYSEQATLTNYVTIINGVEYSLTTNPAATLGEHQVAEYMSEEIALVELDQEISFQKDGETITRIGTGSAANNNAVGNWEEGFHVRSDAINVTMYLKEYEDGGYDFFLTGYTDNYQMNIAGIDFAMTENLDFTPTGNYVREFYVELESVEAGQYFSFTNNGADITENMVVDSGMNNALWDGMGYTFHNTANDVTVYLKLTEDYQHSLWITGFEFADEYVYTINNCPDWIGNNSCEIFAYIISAGYVDTWVPAYLVNATTVKFGTNYEIDKVVLVRCVSGTQTPSWDARGDVLGRIYNQSNDIVCTSGVYTYNSTDWRNYP